MSSCTPPAVALSDRQHRRLSSPEVHEHSRFVPVAAMSAGIHVGLAADTIVMGAHSSSADRSPALCARPLPAGPSDRRAVRQSQAGSAKTIQECWAPVRSCSSMPFAGARTAEELPVDWSEWLATYMFKTRMTANAANCRVAGSHRIDTILGIRSAASLRSS